MNPYLRNGSIFTFFSVFYILFIGPLLMPLAFVDWLLLPLLGVCLLRNAHSENKAKKGIIYYFLSFFGFFLFLTALTFFLNGLPECSRTPGFFGGEYVYRCSCTGVETPALYGGLLFPPILKIGILDAGSSSKCLGIARSGEIDISGALKRIVNRPGSKSGSIFIAPYGAKIDSAQNAKRIGVPADNVRLFYSDRGVFTDVFVYENDAPMYFAACSDFKGGYVVSISEILLNAEQNCIKMAEQT